MPHCGDLVLVWERVEPLLPKYRVTRAGGRPRVDRRLVLDGILYVLRTGCQWKAAPAEFGSASTLHRYSNRRKRARRWVVERSHSWINRFRRLLIRWEKKADNYQAMIHLACAIITWKAAGVLG